MQFRPNDAPCMEKGEKRNFQFKLAGVVGANTITGTPTVTAPGLTVGTVAASGTTVTAPITAPATGRYTVKLVATLSSAEEIVGVIRVRVVDSAEEDTGAARYE